MAVPKAMPTAPQFVPDERQREAIEHLSGPMLVVAGAGTGKTTVLTRRLARLLGERHIGWDQVLAITYSDNSAQDMRRRVQAELPGFDTRDLKVTTFHAYCNDLLRRRKKSFGVLDDKDLWIFLRKRIRELHLNYFVKAANTAKFLDDLLDFMRRCHDELVGPEQYAQYVGRIQRHELPIPRVSKSKDVARLDDEEVLGRCQEIAGVFSRVEAMLEADNLGTFGHMISRAHSLLEDDLDLLASERQHARFILIDEFQDANFAQVKILRSLAGEEPNIFAVGDPDQAIYRFRGASSAAFGLFHRHFPGAKLVVLDKNRRSRSPVLRCAFAVVSKNPDGFDAGQEAMPYRRAALTSARDEEAVVAGKSLVAPPVDVVTVSATGAESADVVATLRRLQRQSRCQWRDFAILYRVHSHRDDLAEELEKQGIPFSIDNMDVMDSPEARDLFACLGAVVSAKDSGSLLRVAALRQFEVDAEKLQAAMRVRPRSGLAPGLEAVLAVVEGGAAVLETVAATQNEIAAACATGRAALEIILRRFRFDLASRTLGAVVEFVSEWQKKPTTKTGEMAELLEYLGYFREARGAICLPYSENDAVRLLTAHASKGLEFKHVVVLRAVSGSFPSSYRESLVEFPPELRDIDSVAQEENKTLHEQEERRLFYVAMTRARDTLTIYAREGKGKKDKSPPGFLRDLLKDRTIDRWLRLRPPYGLQADLFASSSLPASRSRMSDWIAQSPASNLASRLSASALELYETCPLQFKLEREWNLPRDVPAALHYGAAMHRVLRDYYESIKQQRPLSDAGLFDLLRCYLADAGIQDAYQHELYEQQGVEQLQEFLASSRKIPAPTVLETEQVFQMTVASTTIAGRIDRMDRMASGEVVITDYKTGKPQSQEDADKSLQLSIYALAARESWGYRVHHLTFHNLEGSSSVTTHRDDRQLQEAALRVETVAASIVQGQFEAKTGFHCSFCRYRNLCPATEKRVPEGVKASHSGNAVRESLAAKT
jgi:DNA helicase-2/ATP-dependent DNA helicase PcrA